MMTIIMGVFCIFQENGGVILKRENPHKYLLYKPTVSQFLVFLASGHRELPTNGALMIYLSGDGCFSTKPQAEDSRLYLLGPTSFMKKIDYFTDFGLQGYFCSL